MAVSWTNIEERVERDDRGKFDIVVPPSYIEWIEDTTDVYAKIDGVGTFVLSPWAESQFCAKLGIPLKYFKHSPGDLKIMQIRYWIRSLFEDTDRWLLRCRGSVVRGLLSNHYKPFDNHELVELWKGLGFAHKSQYELWLNDVSFHLRAIPQNRRTRGDHLGGLYPGVYIANSEVGRRGISVRATVWRKVCSNGLIAPIGAASFYKRHIWLNDRVIREEFQEAVQTAFAQSEKNLSRLVASREIFADEEVLAAELSRFDSTVVPEDQAREAIRAFRRENQRNLFTVVNALTSLARCLPADDRYELESRAGRLLARV